MKKNLKRPKKLQVNRETLSVLTREEVGQAVGGNTLTCFISCAYGCDPTGNDQAQ